MDEFTKDDEMMAGLLKKIGNLLIYKEPKNEEFGFELLEGENEGIEQVDSQSNEYVETQNNVEQKKSIQRKKPRTTNTRKTLKDNPENISCDLDVNLETIRRKFDMPKNHDIIIREFKIGRKIKAFMAYMEGMVDRNILNLSIFPQLLSKELSDEISKECPVDYLIENVITINQLIKTRKFSEIVLQVLSGLSALFIEGCSECILLDTRGYEKRNVDQPITEKVVKGSQEGFNENLRTNLTLLRRIIKNEKYITEMLPVGKMNNSICAVTYLEGVVNPKVVQEVKKRIKRIDTDFVMGVGMIEQFIEENPYMLFPQVLTTERPDRAASFIMEGQVVILSEGTPFAITVPVTFFRLLHTSEDSYARWPFGTFLRFIRLIGLFCATLLPGIYTAIVLFHPEAIPTELLSSIAAAKESVPFPTVVEVLMLEVAFELIREGGVRVPSVIGQTLGIVGALILGQAAVAAGLVSPILVIVVSVTALGNFAIPNYSLALAIRIERFLFIFAGAILGIYGVSVVFFILAVMTCNMKSFGVPFFTPVAPRTKTNPDVIIKYPIWMQKNRPDGLNSPNRKRQGENVKVWSREKSRSNKRKQDDS